ncbi:MAG TPA: hypothetical protein VNM16_12355 [Bacillota bacterium]|nr:hypothetical protein [Bacillota bacterium]
MAFMEAWRAKTPLAMEGLFALTRPILVEAALGLLSGEFPVFDAAAAKKLRADELNQHVSADGVRLPARSNSQRDQPWADGCAIMFQTFDPTARRDTLPRHDQFRLYRIDERPVAASRGGAAHTWEVCAKIEWTSGFEPSPIESVYVGLLGRTPESAHRDNRVHWVLRRIRLDAEASPGGRYVAQPQRYLAGEGLTYSIGWHLLPEEYTTDAELVAGLTAAARAAWHGLAQALAMPPDPV